jgi:hypothetical protein
MLKGAPFVLVQLLTAWTLVRAARREGWSLLRRSPYALYVLTSTLVLAATLGKAGSNTFYFFEPLLAELLWLVSELGTEPVRRLTRRGVGLTLGLLALAATREVATGHAYRAGQSLYRAPGLASDDRYPELRAELARRGLDALHVLRLGGPHHAFGQHDVVSINDMYLYNLQWQAQRLSVEPLEQAVAAGAYDLVLLPSTLAMPPPADPDQPVVGVLRAVESGYRLAGRDRIYQYYLRDG